jgi:hypothetical protein
MKLLIVFLLLSLSGCTVIDAYLMAKFDSNEYQLVNQIKSTAEAHIQDCNDRDTMNRVVEYLFLKGTEFKNYTAHIPHNEKATALSSEIYKELIGLHNRYADPKKISETYCKTKLSTIEESANTIQEVIGDKPR